MIPKALRDAVGLVPGDVEVVVEGSAIRVEPISGSGLVRRGGRLVIDAAAPLDDETVRDMRFMHQR